MYIKLPVFSSPISFDFGLCLSILDFDGRLGPHLEGHARISIKYRLNSRCHEFSVDYLKIVQAAVELDIVYLGLETRLNEKREHQVSGYITVPNSQSIQPPPQHHHRPSSSLCCLGDPSEVLLRLSVTLSLMRGLGEAFIVLGLVGNSISCSTWRLCGLSFELGLLNNPFSSAAADAF
jgi:hypothetical protein